MAPLVLRELDPKVDWHFFHRLQPLEPEDRACIRPLEEQSARLLWRELVSADPRQRHPMLLPQGHWLGNILACGPDWKQSWPAGSSDVVSEFLQRQIGWPDETQAHFLWMRERAVQVPWGVFLRIWRAFLFSDEAPFLLSTEAPEWVCFPPTGPVQVGRRIVLTN